MVIACAKHRLTLPDSKVHVAKFEDLVKVALDELRMQMLGVQVLFGFQLQGVFQDGFMQTSRTARWADAIAFSFIVLTLGLLIAAPSQHRLVDRGNATMRIFRVAHQFARWALLSFGIAVGLDVFVVADRYMPHYSVALALASMLAAGALWYLLGAILRSTLVDGEKTPMPEETKTDIQAKIEQMLTEARVILPGAQALLGFQFVVTMNKTFSQLDPTDQHIHFASLISVALSILLLITPAAVHRMTFDGQDVPRFHRIGSLIITLALIPLALGLSGDFYLAASRMIDNRPLAAAAAVIVFIVMAALWYAVPLVLRRAGPGRTIATR
jgi:hypothetical protein